MSREVVRVELNPALLTWARRSSGYGLEEVARSVDVRPEVVAAWETGEQKPTIRQLERFANKVKRPLAVLFLPDPPTEPGPPRDFRTLPSTHARQFQPETLLAIREARNIQQDAIALCELLGEALQVRITRGSLRDDPEQLAANARALTGISIADQLRWRDGYRALAGWKSALEESGVLVLQFPMPREDARGFVIESESLPIIAISTKDAPEARIFSLFHEYCHLAIGYGGVSRPTEFDAIDSPRGPKARVETFCNRFAAAFLLPLAPPEVASRLSELAGASDLDTEAIRTVARKFKVSKDVILRRLLTKDLISVQAYRDVAARWAAEAAAPAPAPDRRGGPDFVTVRLQQRGSRFVSLVMDALDRGGISDTEASGYLGVHPQHIDGIREKVSRANANA